MRRLILNGRFLAGPGGAVNAVARDLSMALSRAPGGWDIRLAVPPALAGVAEDLGLPVQVPGRRSGIAWEQLDLPKARRDGVVAGFFNTVPLRGRGYVTMLHDAQVFTTPHSYGRATRHWRRLLSRQAGRPGNHVLTVSEHARKALLAQGIADASRIGVVPNGLGAAGQAGADRRLHDALDLRDGRYCVALATLLPHKNIPLLLEAFADPDLHDIALVLVGSTPRAAFEAAGHPLPANLHFPGFVSDAELAGLYQGALAVLVPSLDEGFGLPALEGMAHGAAALVAGCGALPDVVGEAGILLPPDQPKRWVAAIAALAQDAGQRARLRQAGQARAGKFTWDASAATLLRHLDRWYPA